MNSDSQNSFVINTCISRKIFAYFGTLANLFPQAEFIFFKILGI